MLRVQHFHFRKHKKNSKSLNLNRLKNEFIFVILGITLRHFYALFLKKCFNLLVEYIRIIFKFAF